jgi:2-polyprenyl-6-methoxyphenol hydroxylase-like FAD-dependent oxidoreductase
MAKSETKSSAKSDPKLDVLVLGEHPATYLCAALLRNVGKLRVVHACIPDGKPVERTCVLNPAFFSLHKLLEPLKRKLDLTPIYGIQFLADDPTIRSECRAKATTAYTVNYKEVRTALMKLASDEGVELVTPKQLQIHRLDEKGIDITLGKGTIRPMSCIGTRFSG